MVVLGHLIINVCCGLELAPAAVVLAVGSDPTGVIKDNTGEDDS